MKKIMGTVTAVAGVLAVAFLFAGCDDIGAGTGQAYGNSAKTITIYAPGEIHTYRPYLYFAAVKDNDGKLISGSSGPHFKYRLDGSSSEDEKDAHEIGSTGVYGIGMAGMGKTQSLTFTTPGDWHLHFHTGGTESEVDITVIKDHVDVTSSGTDYKVYYWLEDPGTSTATGEVTTATSVLDIVFKIEDEGTGAPVGSLTPLVYVAAQGGAAATTGTKYYPTGSSGGEYRISGHTWGAAGLWDVTIDLDQNDTTTHADRNTWTQTVSP